MKRLVLIALAIALSACNESAPVADAGQPVVAGEDRMMKELAEFNKNNPTVLHGGRLDVFHDDLRSVTCWKLGSGTLSCWPDWMLTAPPVKP